MKTIRPTLIALSLVAAACGGSGGDEDIAQGTPTTTSVATTSAVDVGGSEDESGEPAPATIMELGDPDPSLARRSLPVIGGLSLGVPDDHIVYWDGNFAMIRPPFELHAGRYQPSMIVALASQIGQDVPLESIEMFTTEALGGIGTAVPSGETLELFGLELERWSFRANPDQQTAPNLLISAYPRGARGPTFWQPFPLAELFLAETPDGVLAIGWIGVDEAELAEARTIFDTVAPTLELANPLASEPSPPATPFGGPDLAPPPDPVEMPADWDAPLMALSQPIDAGTYTSANVGTPMEFTIDDDKWWMQPNFPSWVVLSADDSMSTGDRGMTFRTGLDVLIAVDSNYSPTGPPMNLGDLQALADGAPDNLDLSITEIEIDGRPALQIDAQVLPEGDCSGSAICEYLITTKYWFPGESLRVGFHYRIWQVSEGLSEPVAIFASSPDETWLERAQDVVDSLRFG